MFVLFPLRISSTWDPLIYLHLLMYFSQTSKSKQNFNFIFERTLLIVQSLVFHLKRNEICRERSGYQT